MTTDTRTRYNGWATYETWLYARWLDNERGSSEYWTERAECLWADRDEDEPADEQSTHARIALAAELDAAAEENQPTVSGVWQDWLTTARQAVDWFEVADHYLSEMDGYVGQKAA